MTLYVDSSALLKRYVAETDSDTAERYLLSDTAWLTARHTSAEVRRNLARLLVGSELVSAQRYFCSGSPPSVAVSRQEGPLSAAYVALVERGAKFPA